MFFVVITKVNSNLTGVLQMPDLKGILPLRQYVDSIASAKHSQYSARAEANVAHEDAFVEMRSHILGLYDKVESPHSFKDSSGAVFDCIPVEQQPALRGWSGSIPAAPDLPPREKDASHDADDRKPMLIPSPFGPDRTDWHGNTMACPPGTIPMRRVTLETLTRFSNVRDFFSKGPRGTGRPPRPIEPATVPATHRWAHAFQNVSNSGGHSYLNLWDPPIGANQVFSLAQHWYVGGSGGNLQTAECGWQVYPQLYGDSKPHLFTYWTADDYNTTGCYNLTCGAFVQIGTAFVPGMALAPVSASSGQQYEIELAYWHSGGRWWLYVNGTSGANAIGYYPDTIYKGGALATAAAEIDYGGEVVGTTSFPPMGSGAFANAGWQKAAFQRAIGYWPSQGGGMINANLTPVQQWPNCYTAQTILYGASWFETLWFGGPGGNC
jgi:hypothetical protein